MRDRTGASLACMNGAVLPSSAPETQGVDPTTLHSLLTDLDARLDSLHSLVLVRHGHVVAEASWAPYSTTTPHTMYSISKSFTSAAIGFAVAEGLVSVDDRIVQLFPEDTPADLDARLLDLRVHHLLTMTTGHAEDTLDALVAAGSGSWVRAFLAVPLSADPGSLFVYNTGASYVLSAIVQKVTGERLLDYLTPRLLAPLGISGATWLQDPHGVDLGGFGLSISTRDLAAFGQMLLQRGEFGGRQLLSADWVATATAPLVASTGDSADWQQGYGYQFWTARHGYRGDGAFGQFCLVLPEDDAVVAITASLQNMQTPLDVLWGCREALFSDAVAAEDADAGGAATYSFEVSSPVASSEMPFAAVDGIRFRLDASGHPGAPETLALHRGAEGTTLLLGVDGVEHRLVFGSDAWMPGTADLGPGSGSAILARGAWVHEGEFRGRVLDAGGPHGFDHSVTFHPDNSIEWVSRELVSFEPIVERRVRGRPA